MFQVMLVASRAEEELALKDFDNYFMYFEYN